MPFPFGGGVMLGHGEYHLAVPRTLKENLDFRLKLQEKCLKEPKYRAAVRHMCETDILFWINAFAWQFNPKPSGEFTREIGPFITWGYQDEALMSQDSDEPGILWCIEHGEDMVVEKSRDMGASWLFLLVILWMTLFHSWKKFTLISKDEASVDKPGERDSLFWKIDFIMSYLPVWLVGEVVRMRLMLECKRTNSSISGYASTGTSGVGGRATAVFVDEFSLIKQDRELFSNTADVTNCRIFNGTHRGTAGMFYDLCDRGSEIGRHIKKLQMHWSKHPDKGYGAYRWDERLQRAVMLDHTRPFPADYDPVKDGTPAGGPFPGLRSPWYDKECIDRGGDSARREIALHLDMDPKGSSNQFFDPLVISQLIREYARPEVGRYDVMYDTETGRPLKGTNGSSLVKSPSGHLWLWRDLDMNGLPMPDYYGVGGDLSAGTGATPSVFSFMNSRGEKVAQYFNANIEPTPLAPLIVALCWLFADEEGNGANLSWEMNGPGVTFGKKVIELGYRRVHYREVNQFGLGWTVSDQPGWYPSKNARRVLLEDYRDALQTRTILNPCESSLRTCLDYVWKGDTVDHDRKSANPDESGARENHGDEVIGDAQAWMMVKKIVVKPKVVEKKLEPYSREWLKEYRKMHTENREDVPVWG